MRSSSVSQRIAQHALRGRQLIVRPFGSPAFVLHRDDQRIVRAVEPIADMVADGSLSMQRP